MHFFCLFFWGKKKMENEKKEEIGVGNTGREGGGGR
jgi:hypothetical protein